MPLEDPFRDDGAKTCQDPKHSGWPHNGPAPQIRQSMPGMGLTARRVEVERQRLLDHQKLAAQMAKMNATQGARPGTGGRNTGRPAGLTRAQSAVGARRDNGNIIAHNLPSVRSNRSTGSTRARVARLESMLAQMQRDRNQLVASLRDERAKRQSLESELRAVRGKMSHTMASSRRQAEKLKAYREVMQPLVKAMGSSHRK